MATFKPIVFSTGRHVKQDGTANIKIRIYHNKESQYISTAHYIEPHYFAKNGEVSEDYQNADMLNFELGETVQQYRKIALQLGGIRLQKMACKELKDYIETLSEPESEFVDLVKFSKQLISTTSKSKTAEWYDVSLKALTWYYKKESIDVMDISSKKLTAFMKQLSISGPKGKGLEPGAINNYIRGIRALFNKCKLEYNDDDLNIIRIPHDPFAKLKIPQYRRKRKNIRIEEIKAIRDRKLSSERENIGRDVFMMMFYLMGINVNDLYLLKPPVAGRLEYERSKTTTDDNINNFLLSIKIEPEVKELIDKYSDNGFLSVLKSRYSCSYNLMKAVNKGLESICKTLEYPKITTNWARHTWASLARNKAGISKADIDFCLGHVNNDYKMADIYIEIDYSIYDEVNRKVLDLLK